MVLSGFRLIDKQNFPHILRRDLGLVINREQRRHPKKGGIFLFWTEVSWVEFSKEYRLEALFSSLG